MQKFPTENNQKVMLICGTKEYKELLDVEISGFDRGVTYFMNKYIPVFFNGSYWLGYSR